MHGIVAGRSGISRERGILSPLWGGQDWFGVPGWHIVCG